MKKDIHIDSDAKHFRLLDLDTIKIIPWVTSADDEEGWYIQIKKDENGNSILTDDEQDIVKEKKFGNIKLIDIRGEK